LARPRAQPKGALHCHATPAAVTNRLFRAAVFELATAGWWDAEVHLDGLRQPLRLPFALEAAGPLPAWRKLAPWIGWPLEVAAVYGVHQFLVRRKARSAAAPANRTY